MSLHIATTDRVSRIFTGAYLNTETPHDIYHIFDFCPQAFDLHSLVPRTVNCGLESFKIHEKDLIQRA